MTPVFEESGVSLYHGGAIDVLSELPEESVNCCITSPPYWGLRDYGDPKQIGLEKTPDEYVEKLVQVFREVRRVLRSDGTVWLNLGDSYATGAGSVGKCPGGGDQGSQWSGPTKQPNRMPIAGLKPKDLVGIPWRAAFALQADGWWLRSDIIWAKPAPMPESVTDRPTRSHEYIFLLAKSENYYFDHEAIKEPSVSGHGSGNDFKRPARLSFANDDTQRGSDEQPKSWKGSSFTGARDLAVHPNVGRKPRASKIHGNSPGHDDRGKACNGPNQELRNKRDVWTVNSEPFPEAHFATFPPALILPCVLAGCPEGGTVLDPFSGAATTALVSRNNGRKAIGCDLNADYIEISIRRLSQNVLDFSTAT